MLDDVSNGADGSPSAPGVELLGAGLSESVFAAAAPGMVARGWSVFPQETSGDRRFPGKLHGRMIKWSEDHDLANRLPTAAFLRDCVLQCASLNVACVFGPASGHTFAVDIDVLDEAMVDAIVGIAEDVLGPTPFMRVGRAPKIALIYRHGPGDGDVVPSMSRFFARVEADGSVSRSGDGLEILGAGKLITFHGRHHKTGRYFKWTGSGSPLFDGPDMAPLVTPDQVHTFLEAVDARYRFHRGSSFKASAVSLKWDEKTWNGVPRIALAAGGAPWVEDAEGFVSDGRESYLTSLTFHMAARMKARIDAVADGGRPALLAAKEEVAQGVLASFIGSARLDPRGRWSERMLPSEIMGKVSHLVDKYVRGDIKLFATAREEDRGPALSVPARVADEDAPDDLAFLRPNDRRSGVGLRGTVEPPPADAPSLEIPADRGPIAKMVQDGLDDAFASFFRDVYGDAVGYGDLEDRKARVHVLKAPTGAGKTSRCIRKLATDPRTKEPHNWKDPDTGKEMSGPAPWVMLLPTYANIEELRSRSRVLNLDGTLSDADLRAQATALGLMAEDELDGKLAELRRDALACGLNTMIYSGKLRAGCRVEDKVRLAMEAGIGTAAFCRATVRRKDPDAKKDDPGVSEEVVCPHYEGCPAIAQRNEISGAHVVFMPHSFLALSIPDELRHVRGVIADERVHHLFLHTATFAATSLSNPRKPPRLTKRDKASDIRQDDLMADRDLAADIALEAMRTGSTNADRCPARALHDYRPGGVDGSQSGLGLVRSALRVCTSAIQRDGNLSPETSLDDVRALCARPTGRDLREEWQFWKIVEERIVALQQDGLAAEALAMTERELEGFQGQWDPARRERLERRLEAIRAKPSLAQGDHDYRIQFLTEESVNGGTSEVIRISWRTVPNWGGVPVLLLDASAAPPIVAKIWRLPESHIVVHDIVEDTGRALNVRIVGVVNQTFSNSSVAASADATDRQLENAAWNLANVWSAIEAVSSLYGHGRVVAGTSILLREVINEGWTCPDNVDWCHYGAMRGLDGFKFHSAAISVGRMEPPTRTIDGLVAALTYDDPFPEEPFDIRGDGRGEDGEALRLPAGDQRLRLRSGHVATLKVPMFSGKWGRLIQRQYREEELLQFVGRLRPVYREGAPPVWFALSSVIPEELVVDDLVSIEDLIAGRFDKNLALNMWEGIRRTGGVVEPGLLWKNCREIFGTPEKAARALDEMRFPVEGEAGSRESMGFSSFTWRSAEGRERLAFVRASVADGVSRLAAALGSRCVGTPRPARLVERGICALARERAPDGVDARIGDRDTRRGRELDLADDVGEVALSTLGEIDASFGTKVYPVGRGMPLRVLRAYLHLKRFWRRRVGGADDRLMPLLTEGEPSEATGAEAPSYEQMGATVVDGPGRLAA